MNSFMARSVKQSASENLHEMLQRIRIENEALKRLVHALEIRNTETNEKSETNKS
jgi:BMFP domain-containing protein YqiC